MKIIHCSISARLAALSLLAGFAICLIAAAQAADSASEVKLYPHVFSYHPLKPGRHRVMLVGDFNSWSRDATPMFERGNGDYSVSLDMTEGVHSYKFLVDGDWANDPRSDAALEESDGFGGKNSAVLIGIDARRFPPPPPGKIVEALLRHDPTNIRNRDVVSATLLRLGFHAQAGNIQSAAIVWSADGVSWSEQEIYPVSKVFGIENFEGLASVSPGPVSYFFKLIDGPATAYLSGGKVYSSMTEAQANAYQCAMQPQRGSEQRSAEHGAMDQQMVFKAAGRERGFLSRYLEAALWRRFSGDHRGAAVSAQPRDQLHLSQSDLQGGGSAQV
jgi:hypothetical protein